MNEKTLPEIQTLGPKDFPPLLATLYDPPDKLFIRGSPVWKDDAPEQRYLCIVGSRKFTQYGERACRALIEGLAGYPITIVSGLAYGIDSVAHEAALGAGLRTIAIPGSGLDWDVLYPRAHRILAQDIIRRGGALISPFDHDFRATPWAFPLRNQVMAGMSHMTIVIEAEEKSGSLITYRSALENGRDVGVVPGSIFSYASAGTNKVLVEGGAHPITSSYDILHILGIKIREENSE